MDVSAEASGALEVRCRNCGAAVVVEAHLKTAECAYCGSHSIVERPSEPGREEPVLALPFVVERERAQALVRRWLASRGAFAHSGLKAAALENVRGVYVPAYLYGAVAETRYTARIGENYTVTESYTGSDGKTHTRTVTKTEWRDLAGRYDRYVADVLVSASRGIPNDELEAVEPFDLRGMRRYSPAMLPGWIAEEPSLDREACRAQAHAETEGSLGRWLAEFMPGDAHENLRFESSLRDEVIDLVLLPVWVSVAKYSPEKPAVRVLLNGQTGEAAGKVPLSATKIALAVALGLALVLAIVLAFAT